MGSLQFTSSPYASEEEAKKAAAVAALWSLDTPEPAMPKAAPVPKKKTQKRLRGHFEIPSPHPKIRDIFTNDEVMQKLKSKSRAKIVLVGQHDPEADLLLRISGREDRFMKAVYQVQSMLGAMPKRLRPKADLHMD